MKNMIVMALTLSALAACGTAAPEANGSAQTETAEAPAVREPVLTSGVKAPVGNPAQARTDAQAADAKAKLALVEVAQLIPGNVAVESLSVGEGFQLRYLSHVALGGWKGEKAEQLSLPVNDRVYPVLSGGNVVASITLHKTDGVWETAAIGKGGASAKLADLRNELRAAHSADGDSYELVHVLALNERFLGHHEQGAGFLTSLKAGADRAPRAESEVFGELSVRAKSRE